MKRMQAFDDFQTRIRNRQYQSPSRARAAVSRAHLKKPQKDRLHELCDLWESESTEGATVGGPPSEDHSHVAELVDENERLELRLLQLDVMADVSPIVLNLNLPIRARLTPYGISLLYAARSRVTVPDDILEQQGVWTTNFWEFMLAMGSGMNIGDSITVGNTIEVLRTRV